jgi:hypothetical protein
MLLVTLIRYNQASSALVYVRFKTLTAREDISLLSTGMRL